MLKADEPRSGDENLLAETFEFANELIVEHLGDEAGCACSRSLALRDCESFTDELICGLAGRGVILEDEMDLIKTELLSALGGLASRRDVALASDSDESSLFGYEVRVSISPAILPAVVVAVVAASLGPEVFGSADLLSNVLKGEVLAALSYLPLVLRIRREHHLEPREEVIVRSLARGARTSAELAARTSIPVRTVRRILSTLKERGLVIEKGRVGGAKEYEVDNRQVG